MKRISLLAVMIALALIAAGRVHAHGVYDLEVDVTVHVNRKGNQGDMADG